MTGGARSEPAWVKAVLIGVAVLFLGVIVIAPVMIVLAEAFRGGWSVFVAAIDDPTARRAIRMTVLVAAIAVPANLVFGVAASWAIARFRFRGRAVLLTLIDLPFAVSPVVAGLVFVLLFGTHGVFGSFLADHDVKIIFALPGIVLTTMFVTFPFVARELIPLMEAQGGEEEEAAVVLGASGWQMFFRVTLPKIKWGLLYGVILCNARAMGEFGAVSVVSGNKTATNTMSLHIEDQYQAWNTQAAFAVASLLLLLGLFTLGAKQLIDWRARRAATEVYVP